MEEFDQRSWCFELFTFENSYFAMLYFLEVSARVSVKVATNGLFRSKRFWKMELALKKRGGVQSK